MQQGEDQLTAPESVVKGTVSEQTAAVAAVAGLDEPTRRRVYDHVRGFAVPVSRDEVAAALRVPRRTAAFHLDRLAELGLLSVTFARRSGRTGPGAGRTAKLYQRSDREVSVSLPARQYDLAGRLLAGAIAEAQQSGETPKEVLDRRARELGGTIARDWSDKHPRPVKREKRQAAVRGRVATLMNILRDNGFEPGVAGNDIVLRNCPFHALAQAQTELVCGMNLQLLHGVVEGLEATGAAESGVRPCLDPGQGRCCVRMEVPD